MADINLLKTLGTIKQYEADDFIVHEGEDGNELYIILSGTVAVYINSHGDFPVKIAEMGTGEMFGEMSILEGLPRSATVIAISDVVVLSVKKENIILFIEKQPEMAYKVMKSLCTRIRSTNDAMKELQNEYKSITKANVDLELNCCKSDMKHNDDEVVNNGVIDIEAIDKEISEVLFLKRHKSFNKKLHSDDKYIYKANVTCPICNKEFKAFNQKISKLRVVATDKDMRRHYQDDFEPLLYNIWVCPECNYASYYHDFKSIHTRSIKKVREKLTDIKKNINMKFDNIETIDQVFAQYYLAIECAKASNAAPIKYAKLWMHLSWLYKDFNDQEMYKKTAKYALKYYLDAYNGPNSEFRREDEQQFCLIIAELYMLNGEVDEAYKYVLMAKMKKNGNRVYFEAAEQRLYEIVKFEAKA
jgi:uncharacterized protein (DUF2225 family)/CRP-like cAMP-binding protein